MEDPSSSIAIFGAGWLGLALARKLQADSVYSVKLSVTGEAKRNALEAEGLCAFQLTAPENLNSESTFWQAETLVISMAPRGDYFAYPERVGAVASTFLARSAGGQIIFTSSTSVYPDTGLAVDETCVQEPTSHNGISIKATERILVGLSERVYILRLAGLIGEDRNPIFRMAGRTGLTGGANRLNLVYRESCLAVICALLVRPIPYGIYNLAINEHPRRDDYYLAGARAYGLELPEFIEPEWTGDKIVLAEKIKNVLGIEFGTLRKF